MKILQLDIKGFRSLKDVTWKPGDLNILIGANGTGKSNLLRFLEMMTVVAKGNLGKYVQSLGGMAAIVWDGEAPDITFKLDWMSGGYAFEEVEPKQLCYKLQMKQFASLYVITNEVLSYEVSRELLIKRSAGEGQFREYPNEKFREVELQKLPTEESLLSAVSAHFWDFSDVPPFKVGLSSIAIYHDIRVDRGATMRSPAVTRYEQRVDPDGQNLISVLHTLYTGNREFKRSVDAAMRAAFGDDYEEIVFPPAADQRIQLRIRWKSLKREQSAADLSDGTLRFLFLLTVLAAPDPPPIIAINEPETGLHPAMLPIIAEHAVDASLRSQVVLSTHSPQLLDAFTDTKPTTTVTKWEDGQTILQNLDGDDLAYWLQGYTLGALFKSGELERMG